MRITLPSFYVPEPDPDERPAAILPEELTPEAQAELAAMREQRAARLAAQESDSLDEQPNG